MVRKSETRRLNLLNALKTEFKSNLAQLSEVIYYDKLVANSSLRLLKMSEDVVMELPVDTLRMLLQNSSYIWTFDAINGALRSGISSGDIHLVKNDSLINLLFSWPDLVKDASENEIRSINHRVERFVSSINMSQK